MVGLGTGESLAKNQVEVSWCDKKDAKWMYCEPIEGRLPEEGTKEAATDLEVLNLLGVEPEIGTEFTVPILVDDKIETSQTFTLCGWWEKDPVAVANHVLIPQSRVEDILKETRVTVPGETGMTGCWNMDVMLGSSMHIEEDLRTILENQEAVQLYGMEAFVLDKLRVVEGDLSRLYEPGGHYVAAVLSEDDYGKEDLDSNWAKVGDRITLRHVEELEFYNRETGESLDMGQGQRNIGMWNMKWQPAW